MVTVVRESYTDIGAAEFRRAMGHFATGVTVVTSIGEDGEPVGTTASAVSSLSLTPPLILACFDLESLTLRPSADTARSWSTCSRPRSSTCRPTSPAAAWPPPGMA